MTPVNQIASYEEKNCMFVRNKSFIKAFNFEPSLLAKIPIHNL